MPKTAISECVKALKALDEALANEQKPKPDGWFTVLDLANERGISREQAARIAKRMVELGVVEQQQWKRGRYWVGLYRVK